MPESAAPGAAVPVAMAPEPADPASASQRPALGAAMPVVAPRASVGLSLLPLLWLQPRLPCLRWGLQQHRRLC
eukprot:9879411-Alexandrium_andersonii.AAC.1